MHTSRIEGKIRNFLTSKAKERGFLVCHATTRVHPRQSSCGSTLIICFGHFVMRKFLASFSPFLPSSHQLRLPWFSALTCNFRVVDVHLRIAHVLLGRPFAVSGVTIVGVVRAGVLGTARDLFCDRLERAAWGKAPTRGRQEREIKFAKGDVPSRENMIGSANAKNDTGQSSNKETQHKGKNTKTIWTCTGNNEEENWKDAQTTQCDFA